MLGDCADIVGLSGEGGATLALDEEDAMSCCGCSGSAESSEGTASDFMFMTGLFHCVLASTYCTWRGVMVLVLVAEGCAFEVGSFRDNGEGGNDCEAGA